MWHTLEQIFTAANLQLLLLTGSGVLAISLLVLAMTRWGHSRPVWKCVILSFVAHILLMGYLYGTRLIFESPQLAEIPDPLRVNLIDDFGSSVTNSTLEELAPADLLSKNDHDKLRKEVINKRWDEFVNVAPLPTTADDEPELERPLIDSEVVIERRPPVSVPSPAFQALEETPAELERPEIANDFEPLPQPAIPAPQNPAFVAELIEKTAELPAAEAIPTPPAAPQTDDFQPLRNQRAPNLMKLVSSPRRIADGQPIPKVYSLRTRENRLELAQRRGGSIETEAAVNNALRWLAEAQSEDGRWDASEWEAGQETKTFGHDRKGAGADADCGMTALATLAFLAAGHTHLEGPYQNELRNALQFLARSQKTNGDLAGDARLFARMYCHSMSLLALGEALAMTGDERLLQPVQRGVDYSVAAQNRTDGSWRYQPGDSGDMSQFGWQVLALHSAKLGGAVVPAETFQRMETFLQKCTSGVGNGLASYRPGQGPSTTMTAEALLCRYFLQDTVSPATSQEAARRLAVERPTPHHVNLYYWYYGTLSMYHTGGTDWEQWNSELKKTLLSLQVKAGKNAGSYDPICVWGGYGGRVYSTAMATLNLEVYYRYLPMLDVADRDENRLR